MGRDVRPEWATNALRLLAALESHYKECKLYDASCELAFDLLELRIEDVEGFGEQTESFRA